MTLRMRLLLISLVFLLTGGGVIGVSYYNIAQATWDAEYLADVEIERLQYLIGVRSALHRLRIAQEQVSQGGGGAFVGEVTRLTEQLESVLRDQTSDYLPRKGRGSLDDLMSQLRQLRAISDEMRQRREALAELYEELGAMGELSQSLQVRIGAVVSRAAGGIPDHVSARLQSTVQALLRVYDHQRYIAADAIVPWGETMDYMGNTLVSLRLLTNRHVNSGPLRKEVNTLLDEIKKALSAVREHLAGRSKIEGELSALSRQWRARFEALWEGAAGLTVDLRRTVRERLIDIQNRRYNSLIWNSALMVAGFGLGGLLIVLFVGRIERDLWTLKDVVRAIERGEVSPNAARLPGGVADLNELGRAFTELATTLNSVRQQQVYRDELVTGLNRSVHLSEILRLSLRSLSQATSSKAGCMYLKMSGREELLLAETFAVPRGGGSLERVQYGEGLVGQVARDRKSVHFDDIPLEGLKIVGGVVEVEKGSVLLVPMVFRGELMGVVELAGLTPFDAETRHFVEDSVFQIAVALNNARAVETIRTSASALEQKTRELEEMNKELERANQLKSEFLATVSHELRTPLNAIIGFTELVMLRDDRMKESSHDNLGKVMRNAEQLLSLITDILDLSRIEAGRVEVRESEQSVARIVEECVDHFRPMADGKGIDLLCEVSGAPERVMVDRDKFTRIVQNLVSNAIKFTEQGEVGVKIWSEDRRLLLEVRDTGIGIDTELLPAIFEKFRQADGSRTRRHGGTGLGLAITKELCHRMGGSVRVSSQKGEGSVFRVSLPLQAPAQQTTEG